MVKRCVSINQVVNKAWVRFLVVIVISTTTTTTTTVVNGLQEAFAKRAPAGHSLLAGWLA